jgi:hypothetical protein
VPILFKYADHLLLGFDIWPWYEKLTNLFRIDIGYADDLTADLVYLDAPSRRDDLGARSARPEKRSLVDIATVHGTSRPRKRHVTKSASARDCTYLGPDGRAGHLWMNRKLRIGCHG